ncbi:MAG: hypothetical protein CR972_05015 [Candidatus Moraniibacteriota bacterium]|nr:MAG: hypothetical protein CR972_05015 [Candidatus Moranbacteria bacterium]
MNNASYTTSSMVFTKNMKVYKIDVLWMTFGKRAMNTIPLNMEETKSKRLKFDIKTSAGILLVVSNSMI